MKKLTLLFFISCLAFFGCKSSPEYSWQTFSIPNEPSLRGIAVFNENIVWVTGTSGTISKTEDGGQTWTRLFIPSTDSLDFRDIKLFSESEALVMSAGEGSKSNLYKTWDAGLTWQLILTNPHPEGFFDGIAFASDHLGYLGGDPVDGKLFVMKTLDRGDHWLRIDPTLLPPLNEGEFGGFAASGSHLTAFGGHIQIATGGQSSRIFRSEDMGNSWEVIDTPIIQGESSQGVFSIDYFHATVGVAVGGDYTKENLGSNNVMLTNDGGKTWTLANDFPVYQSSVRYLSKSNIISVGPKSSNFSPDGGKNWHPIEGEGYHTLAISPQGKVWAAGSGGRIGQLIFNE